MKTISCRNIERFVLNHNKEAMRLQDGGGRGELELECILGTNSEEIRGSVTFALNNEEVIYYSSQYFVVHNLLTKESSIIRKEGSFSHTTLYIDKFQTEGRNDIIFTVERSHSHLFVGQLEITGNITETNGTQSHSDIKNFNWRLSKLSSKFTHDIERLSYHPGKHYLYILASRRREERVEKSLWVYDLRRECILMSPEIKPSVNKVDINCVWVTDDPAEVYLAGKNYFRFWSISFNEKSLKESNYRNIERCLASKRIVRMFYTHTPQGKLLALLTEVDLILLKRNELFSCDKPPVNSIKKAKSKANIEVELENSLNQIYRMKFMFDEEENENKVVEEFTMTPEHVEEESNHFSCASELWNSEGVDCIVVATKIGNLLTYSITNGQMKLLSQLTVKKNHSFDFMTASRKGEVILLSERNCQNLYIINKYSLNSEETEEELKQFWGAGHLNKEDVLSITSPSIHQRVCTLGENATMRLWSFKGKERKIIFEEKMVNQPTQLAMHPCGLLVAVNYPKEIKLMSLLPTGLYEVMSAKTNYNSIGLKYSECGNFLVSNEENLLMFYNPFTLKTLGYLQPPELKSTIIDFQITPQGKFISFLTTDYGFYILPLDLAAYSKYENIQPSHSQRQPYTCFFFQPGIMRSSKGSDDVKEQDLFVGCSQHKYMVLYKNQGKTLINEFPIEDCHITCLCVADGWLFAATSKQSIRVYKWPIFEEECEMEIISLEAKTIKFRPPKCEEYFFWGDGKKILKIHKLGFSNKLVVAKEGGIMSVITYNRTADKSDEPQRKKLMLIVNDSYFITKNESQKRNRLIEKTEGDILKVENEIAKEKSIMQRKYKEECQQIEKTYQQKSDIHLQEKNDYLAKMKMEIDNLKVEITNKKKHYSMRSDSIVKTYAAKKQYEEGRNDSVQDSITQTMATHKQKMKALIESHKEEIRSIKNSYREKIISMRKEFENMVASEYPHLITKHSITTSQPQAKDKPRSRTSIKVKEHKEIVFEPLYEEEINALTIKVEEVKRNNDELANHLEEVKSKVRLAEVEDENMQKDFQRCLEEYNSNRFSNLSLHSEVLKMRTQLVERKEIMENKQEIINMAFQERQKLQNYKELVRGSLSKLQDRKQESHHLFVNKENELTLIFQQLTANINELETIKREEKRVEELTQVILNEKKKSSSSVEEMISRLKELKRYLLLEGLTEDAQQKKLYVQQENLLTTINFYKKRMSMEFLKEKKNKVLKKSALNLVLKQNKNLLEECNQLREETIEYEHEIKNLGRKLGEAKKIISIESKLKEQKSEVVEQRNQLQAIRALFNDQILTYQEDPIDIL